VCGAILPYPPAASFISKKESRIEEGHPLPDHVHMMISIPPKYAVSTVDRDEEVIREYIGHQEHEDRGIDQLNLILKSVPLQGGQGAAKRFRSRRFEWLKFPKPPAWPSEESLSCSEN